MTKVALCYSGRPRNYAECLKNHQDFFGLGQDNVDVFAHLWFDENLIGRPFRPDAPQQGSWPDHSLMDWIDNNWKPKKVIYEKQKDDYFRDMYFDVWNVAHEKLNPTPRMHPKDHQLSMFYGIKKVMEMKQEYEKEFNFKYDYVFRIRTDFVMISNFGIIENYDNKKLHVSHYNPTALINQYRPGTWVEDLGIDKRYIVDIFVMGGSEVMDKYAKVYDNIPLMLESGYPMHSSDVLIGYNTFLIENIPVRRHKSWAYKIYPQGEVYYDGSPNPALHGGKYPGNYGLMQWNDEVWYDY
jgi:hypothetical protein